MNVYNIYPKIVDQGILCICRNEMYLLKLNQDGTGFKDCAISILLNDTNIPNASAVINSDRKSITVKTYNYENPIFLGKF